MRHNTALRSKSEYLVERISDVKTNKKIGSETLGRSIRERARHGRAALLSFVPEPSKVAVREVLERALQGDLTANYEVPLRTKGGEEVELTAQRIVGLLFLL